MQGQLLELCEGGSCLPSAGSRYFGAPRAGTGETEKLSDLCDAISNDLVSP